MTQLDKFIQWLRDADGAQDESWKLASRCHAAASWLEVMKQDRRELEEEIAELRAAVERLKDSNTGWWRKYGRQRADA